MSNIQFFFLTCKVCELVHHFFSLENFFIEGQRATPLYHLAVENLNIMIMENIKKIEREEENREARVFTWFGYVSLRPQDVTQWATSLLILSFCYVLDDYNVL